MNTSRRRSAASVFVVVLLAADVAQAQTTIGIVPFIDATALGKTFDWRRRRIFAAVRTSCFVM